MPDDLAFPKLDPREVHFCIQSPHPKLKLFVRHLPALNSAGAERRPLLYVHGATFPSACSVAHRFDGFSWRDALNEAGFDVWALDFHGFGYSDRYAEMEKPAEAHAPLCNALDAGDQVEAAARFILEHQNVSRLSLISHSWGSMPAGRFAGEHPAMVDRWVLFGPVARRPPRRYETAPSGPAWRVITVENQWTRFVEDVPPGEPPVLSRKHFDEWGEYYLDSDRGSRTRDPVGVKVPAGPFNDILRAWHGELGYDPALVQAPIALIRGEWDGVVPDEDARWLFDAFKASPLKRDTKISRGTHLMHLEVMRSALYQETNAFLLGENEASSPHVRCKLDGSQTRGMTTMTGASRPSEAIPGYNPGSPEVARSPISMKEWDELKASAFFTDEDMTYLRLSYDVLKDQAEELVKVWRGIIFLHPHLLAYDQNPETGEIDKAYASAVAKRFAQWVLDTAKAEYNQTWLDYQYEIGLRHHRTKKNKTDGGHTLGHIRARDMIAFSAAIVAPMKPFLEKGGHSSEVVNRMYDAWWKSMILQVTLWSQPYMREGDF